MLRGEIPGRELASLRTIMESLLEFTLLEFGAVGGEAGCEVHVVGAEVERSQRHLCAQGWGSLDR